jgi:hypothetical protein
MPIAATIKNVASSHCSDEHEPFQQKMERGGGDIGKS